MGRCGIRSCRFLQRFKQISLLRFFDEDKGRKSARKRSRSSDNEQDESGDSEFVFEAPKRANYPSKSRVNSFGKHQEENEQGCHSRETDHEVADLLDSGERDHEGGDVDDTLSLFAGPEF